MMPLGGMGMPGCIPSVFKPAPLGGVSSPLCTSACGAPPHGSTGMHVCPLAVSQSSQVKAWHAMSQCHHTDFTTLDMSQHSHIVTQAYHLHTFHILYCQMAMQVLLFSHLVLLPGSSNVPICIPAVP